MWSRLFISLTILVCLSVFCHAAPGDKTTVGPFNGFANISGLGGTAKASKPVDTWHVIGAAVNPSTKTLTISPVTVGGVSQPHFNTYSTARSAEHAALGTAAYQPTSAFDPFGAAAAVKDTTTKTGILKGNGSVISAAANSDLPAMSATVGGAVPTPPNDAAKFLNGAAGFTVPAGTYALPAATSTVLGGVKPDGTSILNTAGAISVTSASIGSPSGSGTSTGTNTGDQTITLSGDATGSGTAGITVNVGKINGDVVDSAARSTGDFLRYDGSQWRHVALVSGDIPNNAANTTGNAATTSALASTPTLCTGGQVAVGILANGNATGCVTKQDVLTAGVDYIAPPAWTSPSYNAGDFTANSSMTWTVDAGDVTNFQYTISGKTMTVNFYLSTTSIGGTPSTNLQIKIPASKVSAKQSGGPVVIDNGTGVYLLGIGLVTASGTNIIIRKADGSNWLTSANTAYVYGQMTFEIN